MFDTGTSGLKMLPMLCNDLVKVAYNVANSFSNVAIYSFSKAISFYNEIISSESFGVFFFISIPNYLVNLFMLAFNWVN